MLRPVLAAVLLLAAAGVAAGSAQAEAPKVVTSIKPIHSLVAAVMQGVGTPTLLVKGAGSPHTYAMKPSDAKALQQADVVFWVGPGLEAFLVKPIKTVKGRTVALIDAPGLSRLETREGGAWEDEDDHDDHGHGHKHGHDDHDHGEVETHIWLDPANARAIVTAAAGALAEQDPANAAIYRANAGKAGATLDALDAELRGTLAAVKGRPFVVFHDAYQHLESRYGLSAIGSITVSPERKPSAKRLKEIRAKLSGLKAACVFAEPQFEPALVDTVIEGTGARKGVLDPEGADIADGPELYPTLMRRNADALVRCLAG